MLNGVLKKVVFIFFFAIDLVTPFYVQWHFLDEIEKQFLVCVGWIFMLAIWDSLFVCNVLIS